MIFTIAQTFFYALWQAFGYSMATLGLHRAGLLLAYYFNMAAGATIVVVSSAVFFATLLLGRRR